MRQVGGIAIALACSLGVLSAALAQYNMLPTRPVDATFRVMKAASRDSAMGPFEISFYIKLFAQNGHVAVCAAYSAAVTAITQNALADQLANRASAIVIAQKDDPSAPRVSPLRFFVFNQPRPLGEMQAGCIETSLDWKPDYARGPLYLNVGPGYGR